LPLDTRPCTCSSERQRKRNKKEKKGKKGRKKDAKKKKKKGKKKKKKDKKKKDKKKKSYSSSRGSSASPANFGRRSYRQGDTVVDEPNDDYPAGDEEDDTWKEPEEPEEGEEGEEGEHEESAEKQPDKKGEESGSSTQVSSDHEAEGEFGSDEEGANITR